MLIVSHYFSIFSFKELEFLKGPLKGQIEMSESEELLKYILNLSPEKAEKLISHLPQLTSLLEVLSPPYPQARTVQTQSA